VYQLAAYSASEGMDLSDDLELRKEWPLIERLRRGDNRAAEEMVREHAGWMLTVARNYVRDDALAEDCVQEAFFNAFRKIGDFDGRCALKSWLHRIVVNAALTKLRSLKRDNNHSIEEFMPEFDENGCRIEPHWYTSDMMTPADILERNDLRAFVISKIDKLPEQYRVVVLLKDIEELSTAEVAAMLNVDEGNVRVRLHRARSALKKLIEPLLRKDFQE